MQNRRWGWKEKLVIYAWNVLFFCLLRPMFDISHPFGSDDLTLRLIGTVVMSALLSGVLIALASLILES